jgi:hypothetical protein
MALELAGAGGRTDPIWGQADRGPVNIMAGGGRGCASNTVDHHAALVAGSASALRDPERSAL